MATPGRNSAALVILLLILTGSSCRTGPGGQPPLVQPGAPGEESRNVSANRSAAAPEPAHTAADIKFVQGMIHHHAQALDMTALLATRTSSEDMKKLALRIELSQEDEITMMQEWLAARGADVPDDHAHHAPGAPLMPGMLTDKDMARLEAARGVEFDRLFLEYMISHHEGAIVMVKELFATPGAGQEAEIFAFASDVDADQLIEIRRMESMLKELKK